MKHFISISIISILLISCRPEQLSSDYSEMKDGGDQTQELVVDLDLGEDDSSPVVISEDEQASNGEDEESESESEGESQGGSGGEAFCDADIRSNSNKSGSIKNIFIGNEAFLLEKANGLLNSEELSILESFINVTNFPTTSSRVSINETDNFRMRSDSAETVFVGNQGRVSFRANRTSGEKVILFAREGLEVRINNNLLDNVIIFLVGAGDVCLNENGQTHVNIEILARNDQDVFISGKGNATSNASVTSIIHRAKNAKQDWTFNSLDSSNVDIKNTNSLNSTVKLKGNGINESQIEIAQMASQLVVSELDMNSFRSPSTNKGVDLSIIGERANIKLHANSLGRGNKITIIKDVSGLTELETRMNNGPLDNMYRRFNGALEVDRLELVGQ